MPKVSVIIPAYNASAFIGKCLESIQCQTLSDIEVIVVDDGSTDNTREIVGAFASKDARISLIKQQNSFAGVARNNGMKHAEGEYLYFLDADDFIAETMLEDMVNRMEIDSSDVALCRSEYYDNNNGKTWDIDYSVVVPDLDVCYNEGRLDDSIFQCCVGWPWDKLFRSSFVRAYSLEYQDLRTTNDALFVFLAMCFAKRISVLSGKYVFHRTNNADSLQNTRSRSWRNGAKAALAIEGELRKAGVFARYSRSYTEWLFHFAYWNYSTLSGESKNGILDFMEKDVRPRLKADLVDTFSQVYEQKAARILMSDHSLIEMSMDLCIDYQKALDEINRLDSSCREKEARYWDTVNELKPRIDELEKKIGEAETKLNEVKGSVSYKIGRAITAGPRKVKSAISG